MGLLHISYWYRMETKTPVLSLPALFFFARIFLDARLVLFVPTGYFGFLPKRWGSSSDP